jgi:hypothetical protein
MASVVSHGSQIEHRVRGGVRVKLVGCLSILLAFSLAALSCDDDAEGGSSESGATVACERAVARFEACGDPFSLDGVTCEEIGDEEHSDCEAAAIVYYDCFTNSSCGELEAGNPCVILVCPIQSIANE